MNFTGSVMNLSLKRIGAIATSPPSITPRLRPFQRRRSGRFANSAALLKCIRSTINYFDQRLLKPVGSSRQQFSALVYGYRAWAGPNIEAMGRFTTREETPNDVQNDSGPACGARKYLRSSYR
jgi:hypothetical protein